IEHTAGAFPVWVSPVQVKVLPITDAHNDYAREVVATLSKAGIRVELDDRSERLQAKIRAAAMEKVPYTLVVGDKEAEAKLVAVRERFTKDQEILTLNEFVNKIATEVQEKK
ncbi:MAG: His/Gly/Thr/Pro-type tRNA ligase C-terminal domain-containing protein, partial [Microgenomates group bacterium]